MGLFGFLNSSEKALDIADKTVENVSAGMDAMFYTEEEKAQAFAKRLEIADMMAKTHIKHMEALSSESTVRSMTRRIVAQMIFAFTFLSLPVIGIVYYFDHTVAKFMVDLYCAFYIPQVLLAAAIFFFGNHMLGTIQAGKK